MGSLSGHKFSDPASVARNWTHDNWFASRICDCHLARFHCTPGDLSVASRDFIADHKQSCFAVERWPYDAVRCEGEALGLACKCGAWHELSHDWVEQPKRPMWGLGGRGPMIAVAMEGNRLTDEPPDAPNLVLSGEDHMALLLRNYENVMLRAEKVDAVEYARCAPTGSFCGDVEVSDAYRAKVKSLHAQVGAVTAEVMRHLGANPRSFGWMAHYN